MELENQVRCWVLSILIENCRASIILDCGRLSIGIIGLEINETIFDLFIYINSLKSNEVLESSSVIA